MFNATSELLLHSSTAPYSPSLSLDSLNRNQWTDVSREEQSSDREQPTHRILAFYDPQSDRTKSVTICPRFKLGHLAVRAVESRERGSTRESDVSERVSMVVVVWEDLPHASIQSNSCPRGTGSKNRRCRAFTKPMERSRFKAASRARTRRTRRRTSRRRRDWRRRNRSRKRKRERETSKTHLSRTPSLSLPRLPFPCLSTCVDAMGLTPASSPKTELLQPLQVHLQSDQAKCTRFAPCPDQVPSRARSRTTPRLLNGTELYYSGSFDCRIRNEVLTKRQDGGSRRTALGSSLMNETLASDQGLGLRSLFRVIIIARLGLHKNACGKGTYPGHRAAASESDLASRAPRLVLSSREHRVQTRVQSGSAPRSTGNSASSTISPSCVRKRRGPFRA